MCREGECPHEPWSGGIIGTGAYFTTVELRAASFQEFDHPFTFAAPPAPRLTRRHVRPPCTMTTYGVLKALPNSHSKSLGGLFPRERRLELLTADQVTLVPSDVGGPDADSIIPARLRGV